MVEHAHDAVEHDSDDHNHETPSAHREIVDTRTGSMIMRLALTLLGAGAIIVGGFLEWTRGITGGDLSYRVFWEPTFQSHREFLTSAGLVVLVFGILAIVGLAPTVGWLVRLAGALAIVAIVLFVVQLFRGDEALGVQEIGPGPWVVLAGAIVTLIAGLLPERRVVAASADA